MVRIVTSWLAVEASRSKLGVCLAFVCLVVVAGIAEPNTSKAQITQGPSGPFMAEDSTGRVVGAADTGDFNRLQLWITVGSVTAPIMVQYEGEPPSFVYSQFNLYFATPNCTGQAYVGVSSLYGNTIMTTTAAIFSIGDAAETIYVSDPSSTPIALTMNSRLEGSICHTYEEPLLRDVFEANPAGGALASEFTPPFYVVPNPAYNTAMSVPIGAPWALAVVLAGAYLNVLRRKRTSE